MNPGDAYGDRMDIAMENLAVAPWGSGNSQPIEGLPGNEIVEIAARKINTLKKIVLSTGLNKELLDIIMEEV